MTERKTSRSKKPTVGTENSLQRACLAAKTAMENRGRDVVLLDMRGLVKWVDYMVLVTGTSRRQIVSIADEIEKVLKEMGDKKIGTEGYQLGAWVVLDFEDILIHVFDDEKRHYYELENLWADAPRIDWKAECGIVDPNPADTTGQAGRSAEDRNRSNGQVEMQANSKVANS